MNIEIIREHPSPPPIKEVVLRLTEEQAMFICYLASVTRPAPRAANNLYNKLSKEINYSYDKVDFGISF